jgi:hypothetical protein
MQILRALDRWAHEWLGSCSLPVWAVFYANVYIFGFGRDLFYIVRMVANVAVVHYRRGRV